MAAPRRMNPVEENACRVEAIRKEQYHFNVNETFTLNPRSRILYVVLLLTEKPNRSTFQRPDSQEIPSDLKDKLLKMTAEPKAKSAFPVTSNQEIGWDADLVTSRQFRNRQTWSFTKPVCAETKYASSYFNMTGKSPYAHKNRVELKK